MVTHEYTYCDKTERQPTRTHTLTLRPYFFILFMEERHSFSTSRDQNERSHFCRKNVLRIKLIKNRVLKRNDIRQCVCDIIFGFSHELLALCVEVPITTTLMCVRRFFFSHSLSIPNVFRFPRLCREALLCV